MADWDSTLEGTGSMERVAEEEAAVVVVVVVVVLRCLGIGKGKVSPPRTRIG